MWYTTYTKKGQDNDILIKLDMSKAYDRIFYTFLIRNMRAFGFNWCDLIFRCISNNWYTVWFLQIKLWSSPGGFASTKFICSGYGMAVSDYKSFGAGR